MEKMERGDIRYSRLSQEDRVLKEDRVLRTIRQQKQQPKWRVEAEDLRFKYEILERVPWKSIFLALFLMLFGTFLIVISHLIFTAHLGGETSQAFGFLVLGILVFLPGFYETRIAYYSWRGFKGYSFSRIPAY